MCTWFQQYALEVSSAVDIVQIVGGWKTEDVFFFFEECIWIANLAVFNINIGYIAVSENWWKIHLTVIENSAKPLTASALQSTSSSIRSPTHRYTSTGLESELHANIKVNTICRICVSIICISTTYELSSLIMLSIYLCNMIGTNVFHGLRNFESSCRPLKLSF